MWQKHKVFAKTFMGICFYTRRDYVKTLAVWHRAEGYLKKPTDFYKKTIMITQLRVASWISIIKIQYDLWDTEGFTKKYTLAFTKIINTKITVWLGKTF